MRTFGSFIFGVIATIAIIAAIPLWWAQQNLVDAEGYSKLTANLAQEADLQTAISDNLVVHADEVIADKAKDIPASQAAKVEALKDKIAKSAKDYAAGPGFAKTFAAANESVHEQLLGGSGTVSVDLAPFAQQAFAKIDDPLAKEIPAAIAKQDLSVNLAPASGSTLLTAMPLITPAAQLAAGTAGVATLLALLLGRRRGSVLVWLGVFTALATGVSIAVTKFGAGVLAGGGEGLVGSLRALLVTGVTESMWGWQRWALIGSGAAVVVGIIWLVATRNRRRDDDEYYDDREPYDDGARPAAGYPDGTYQQRAYQETPAGGEAYRGAGYDEASYSEGGVSGGDAYAPAAYPAEPYPGSTAAGYARQAGYPEQNGGYPAQNGGSGGEAYPTPATSTARNDTVAWNDSAARNDSAVRNAPAARSDSPPPAGDRPFPSRRELRNAERNRQQSSSGAEAADYDEDGTPGSARP